VTPDRSVCVNASAGSGKTTRLVEQYFGHIEGEAPIGAVLALAFNDEAAANMRGRIRERTMARGDERTFDLLHWAQVMTFHSFCAQVLREFHLQAGVPSNFTVIEDMDLAVLMDQAWEGLMVTPDPALRRDLVDACTAIGDRRLRQTITFLYERRARAAEALAAMEDREAFLEGYRRACQGRLREVLGKFDDPAFTGAVGTLLRLADRYAKEGGGKAASYLHRARPLLLACGDGDPRTRLAALQGLLEVKGARNMGDKAMGEDKDALGAAYGTLRAFLEAEEEELLYLPFDVDPDCQEAAVEHLMALRAIFLAYAALMDRRKAEENALDFNDLLLRAQWLLSSDRPDNQVLGVLRERYRYVLVDEYQDTDLPQDRIVRALLGGEKGKLFVVGDGKQSIYLFRGADVSIFKDMRRFVRTELQGTEEEQGNNFRSCPEVVAFVNRLFGRIMDREEADWEFKYAEVRPHRTRDRGSVTVVQVAKGGADDKLAMARAVADQIERLVAGDGRAVHPGKEEGSRAPRYGDVAVLLRGRTNLRYYESVLAERDIPYAVEKGIGLFQRQEVMDIANALAFLGNQADDVALYGLLRSPYFGLSDETLCRVVASSSGQLFSRLRRLVDERPDEGEVGRAYAVLSGLLRRCRAVPVSEVLNALLQETGVLGVYAGLPNGRQMIANVEQLLGTVRRKEQEGPFTLYDLVDWLNASMAGSEREGQAQLEAAGDAVRIMTVHASKGLEFPVVLVPEAEATPREERDPAALTPTGMFTDVPTPDLSLTYPPAPLRPALRELKEKAEAQNLRLFYVAATRARDHLVVLGGRKRKEGVWEQIDKDRRDWFALTLNGLGIADAEAGTIPLDGDGRYALSLETFEAAGGGLSLEPVRPCMVPDGLVWTPAARARPGRRTELVLPSALDGRVEGRMKWSEGSRLKRLLTSRGMDAAEYGTLVHEALRGKEAGALLRFSRASLSPEETEWAARELQGIVTRFMAAEPMASRAEGGRDLTELPFELREGDRLYRGTIDRLVRLRDGTWALIDYKTIGSREPAAVVEAFRGQMEIYAKAARGLVGERVRAFLYLTESGAVVEL